MSKEKEELRQSLENELQTRINHFEEIDKVFLSDIENIQNLRFYAIPIIYSIWEGFITQSFSIYLKGIIQELNPNQIKNDLLVYILEKELPQIKDYNRLKDRISFMDKLKLFFSQPLKECKFITEQNVNFKQLNKILKMFSLIEISEKGKNQIAVKNTLDNLVQQRNSISHGKDLITSQVSTEDYKKYRTLIIDLIYDIIGKIMEGFEEKTFLENNK